MAKIILPESEQRRIVNTIDQEITRRSKLQERPQEDPRLTFLWSLISHLRAFSLYLGEGLGIEQVKQMETLASQARIPTPAKLTFILYQAIQEHKQGEEFTVPSWVAGLLEAPPSPAEGDPSATK